jgi:gamma-D-glutamyl-L-lysine dipeptidyl-peptidase
MLGGVIIKHGTDLRREPTSLQPGLHHQSLRETQLSFGEPVVILEQSQNWVRVETTMQPHKKGYYKGWVSVDELAVESFQPTHVMTLPNQMVPLGAFVQVIGEQVKLPRGGLIELLPGLRPLKEDLSFERFVEDVHHFIGTPYLWGGCGLYNGSDISVDCSSLIHLCLRMQGKIVPRDASDQAEFFPKVEKVEPGVALYLARNYAPTTITHVVICIAKDLYIHAPQSGEKVCLLRWGKEIYPEGDWIGILGREHPYVPYPRALISV